MRLCDIGAAIQETMESHEVELDGKTYQVICRCLLYHAHDAVQQTMGIRNIPPPPCFAVEVQ